MTTTTATLALPKPEATDPLANGYDAIADLADRLELLFKRHGATSRRAVTQQVIATGSGGTAIAFDQDGVDTDGYLPAVPASRFTIPAGFGGLYSMSVNLVWATITTGLSYVDFLIDSALGAAFDDRYRSQPSNANRQWSHSIAGIPLLAGQTVDVVVAHGSGANRNIEYAEVHLYRVGQ